MKLLRQSWLILTAAALVAAVAAAQGPPAGPQDGPAAAGPALPAVDPAVQPASLQGVPAPAGQPAAGTPDSYEAWVQSLQPAEQLAAGNPYVRPHAGTFEGNDVGRIPVRIFNADFAGGAYPTEDAGKQGKNAKAAPRPVRSPTAMDLTDDLNRVSNTGVQQTAGVRQTAGSRQRTTQAPAPPAPGQGNVGTGPLPPQALMDLPPGAVVTDPHTGAVIGVAPGGTPAMGASLRQPGPPTPTDVLPRGGDAPPTGPPPGPPTVLDELGFKALYHDGIEPIYYKGLEGAQHCLGPPCDRRFYLHGWLEQGFTLNPDNPRDRQNGPVLFNDRSNEYMLNQLYVYGGRRCETDGCHWDYGARVDFTFGEDARFLQSTGLELHQDGSRNWMAETTELYTIALPQLYAEVSAPVAGGLNLKVGHFYSIFGFERLTAPDSFFYSHSYSRIFGMPFTHTGALATQYLPPNIFFKKDQFSLSLGLTRGWDTWARKDGGDLGLLAGFSIDILDRRSSFSGALHYSEELTPFLFDGRQLGKDNVVVNLIYTKQLTDRLAYVGEFTGGSQNGGKLYIDQVTNTTAFGNARWYGLNNYLLYEINSMWSAGARLEWFYDADALRVARVPVAFNPGGDTFIGNNYFNLTMGLNWMPYPRVLVRPELRVDWSDFQNNPDVSVISARPYDDATKGSQFLLSTDVILSF